ncbi:MAG: FeoA family protein [bacterium]
MVAFPDCFLPDASAASFLISGPRHSRPPFVPLRTSPAPHSGAAPLRACPVGHRATIMGIHCAEPDAQRLRSLGVFEGAQVGVVDIRSGMVLDVRGSRLALGWDVVGAITVRLARP